MRAVNAGPSVSRREGRRAEAGLGLEMWPEEPAGLAWEEESVGP